MKDRITLTNKSEIQYIINLVEENIKIIEKNLTDRQEFLRKIKGDIK